MRRFNTSATILEGLYTIVLISVLISAVMIADHLSFRLDLTQKAMYSISEASIEVIDELSEHLDIYYVTRSGEENISILALLESYETRDKITVRVLDGDRDAPLLQDLRSRDPLFTSKHIPQSSVIISMGDRSRIITAPELYKVAFTDTGTVSPYGFQAEQIITSAIITVADDTTSILYEIIGHGEYTLEELSIRQQVISSGFSVRTLPLPRTEVVPQDASVLLLLSPEIDLTEREADLIDQYLDRGGRLFAALDYTRAPLPNLKRLLSHYHVELLEGIVMEFETQKLLSIYSNSPVAFIPEVTETSDLEQQELIILQSIGFREHISSGTQIEYAPILRSSASSVLRTDLSRTEPDRAESDIPGPIDLAVKVVHPSAGTIILVGSASSLGPLPKLGQVETNTQAVLSCIAALVPNRRTITVPSRGIVNLPLIIPAKAAYGYAVLVTGILPALILACGWCIRHRRKSR